jgi:hypothetical protein
MIVFIAESGWGAQDRPIRMAKGISVLIVTATTIVTIDHFTASLAVGDRGFC